VTTQRNVNGTMFMLTFNGTMEFDSADAASMLAAGILDDVVLHEMGHVLGYGSLWNAQQFGCATCQNVYHNDGIFRGVNGNAMYTREISVRREFFFLFGGLFNLLCVQNRTTGFIPVELGGSAGTKHSHWDEFDNGGCCTGWILLVDLNG
jgi:hypothetical protein